MVGDGWPLLWARYSCDAGDVVTGSGAAAGESQRSPGESGGRGEGGLGNFPQGRALAHSAQWDRCSVFGRLCRTDSPGPAQR